MVDPRARHLAVIRADRVTAMFLALQAPFIGLLIMLTFSTNVMDTNQGSYAILMLWLLVVGATWLGASNAARELVKERAIFRRERAVGQSAARTCCPRRRCWARSRRSSASSWRRSRSCHRNFPRRTGSRPTSRTRLAWCPRGCSHSSSSSRTARRHLRACRSCCRRSAGRSRSESSSPAWRRWRWAPALLARSLLGPALVVLPAVLVGEVIASLHLFVSESPLLEHFVDLLHAMGLEPSSSTVDLYAITMRRRRKLSVQPHRGRPSIGRSRRSRQPASSSSSAIGILAIDRGLAAGACSRLRESVTCGALRGLTGAVTGSPPLGSMVETYRLESHRLGRGARATSSRRDTKLTVLSR